MKNTKFVLAVRLSACLCATLIGANASPAYAETMCPYITTTDQCPTATSTLHHLSFSGLLGSPDLSGNDTIVLGVSGSRLQACVNGTWYYVWDDSQPGTVLTGLIEQSYFCTSTGNDTITIATGSITCGGSTMQAFNYNGEILLVYSQAGGDTVNGGNGINEICGGSGADLITGGNYSDFIYGLSGNDRLRGGSQSDWMYGGNGSDCMSGGAPYSDGYADRVYAEENASSDGAVECVQDDFNTYASCGTGSGEADAMSVNSTDCEGSHFSFCSSTCLE